MTPGPGSRVSCLFQGPARSGCSEGGLRASELRSTKALPELLLLSSRLEREGAHSSKPWFAVMTVR